jgi:hypothetical protein
MRGRELGQQGVAPTISWKVLQRGDGLLRPGLHELEDIERSSWGRLRLVFGTGSIEARRRLPPAAGACEP